MLSRNIFNWVEGVCASVAFKEAKDLLTISWDIILEEKLPVDLELEICELQLVPD